MIDKEGLQNAADEARKAARAGREFATLLDDYAKYLMQPNWRQRAEDSYRSALNKLNVINEGLVACHRIVEENAVAVASDLVKREALKEAALPQKEEEVTQPETPTQEPHRHRSIRVQKKAVGE